MDKAIDILEDAVLSLEREKDGVLTNYRYNWMTSEQKVNLELNIVREIAEIREAIDHLVYG